MPSRPASAILVPANLASRLKWGPRCRQLTLAQYVGDLATSFDSLADGICRDKGSNIGTMGLGEWHIDNVGGGQSR
jgi:hypothetical protein